MLLYGFCIEGCCCRCNTQATTILFSFYCAWIILIMVQRLHTIWSCGDCRNTFFITADCYPSKSGDDRSVRSNDNIVRFPDNFLFYGKQSIKKWSIPCVVAMNLFSWITRSNQPYSQLMINGWVTGNDYEHEFRFID